MISIDPELRLTATSDREERMLLRAAKKGLTLRRMRPGSKAVVLEGPGVHVVAHNLEALHPNDFIAVNPASGRRL